MADTNIPHQISISVSPVRNGGSDSLPSPISMNSRRSTRRAALESAISFLEGELEAIDDGDEDDDYIEDDSFHQY